QGQRRDPRRRQQLAQAVQDGAADDERRREGQRADAEVAAGHGSERVAGDVSARVAARRGGSSAGERVGYAARSHFAPLEVRNEQGIPSVAVKIRLMRVGKKKQPTYRVVVADGRSPRDGRFIEIIGQYAPRQDPSSCQIDAESALSWLRKGA